MDLRFTLHSYLENYTSIVLENLSIYFMRKHYKNKQNPI